MKAGWGFLDGSGRRELPNNLRLAYVGFAGRRTVRAGGGWAEMALPPAQPVDENPTLAAA